MMLVENVFSLPLIGHLHLLSTKQSDKLHSGLKVKPQNHGKMGFCVVADFKVKKAMTPAPKSNRPLSQLVPEFS